MSTRDQANYWINRLSTTGRGNSVYSEDNPPPIAALFGKTGITGGPTIGPDGKIVFNPYQGSSGIFGGWSRNQANAKTDEIKRALYMNQLASDAAIATEKERGNQNRLTARIGGRQGRKTLRTRGDEDRKTADNSAAIALAQKWGIPKEKLGEFTQDFTDLAKSNVQNEITTSRNKGEVLSTTPFKEALTQGLIGEVKAPHIKNLRDQVVTAGPGQITTVPAEMLENTGILRGSTSDREPTMNEFGYPTGDREITTPGTISYPAKIKPSQAPMVNPQMTTIPVDQNAETLRSIISGTNFGGIKPQPVDTLTTIPQPNVQQPVQQPVQKPAITPTAFNSTGQIDNNKDIYKAIPPEEIQKILTEGVLPGVKTAASNTGQAYLKSLKKMNTMFPRPQQSNGWTSTAEFLKAIGALGLTPFNY